MLSPYRRFYLAPRPAKEGLFVRSIGHFSALFGENEEVKVAHFAEFFWCLEGSAEFRLAGKKVTISRNEAWFYPVGSLHDYRPCREGFHYWWVTLEGEGTEALCRGLDLKPGRLRPGTCPEELFRSIDAKIRSHSPEDRLFCLAQLFRLMTLLALPGGKPSGLVERAKELMEESFTSPQFNVAQMAELLQVSRVVLSRQFSQQYAMAPSQFLHGLRLRKALELLRESTLSLKEVAQMSGFSSQEYFIRVIRHTMGDTPGAIRRQQKDPPTLPSP